jgi:hypothetical protein
MDIQRTFYFNIFIQLLSQQLEAMLCKVIELISLKRIGIYFLLQFKEFLLYPFNGSLYCLIFDNNVEVIKTDRMEEKLIPPFPQPRTPAPARKDQKRTGELHVQ